MSATTPFMRLHGERLLDAGYHIIPIASGKKFPGQYSGGRWEAMPSWSRFSHHKPSGATVDMWANWPGAGVGIVTGGASGVIGVDIDILDETLANDVKMIIFKRLGVTPLVRVGLAPKMMLLYRVGRPMNKISLQPIEVLATGQQFVAYGVHPDTGRDYHWPVESPTETRVDSLPLVTEEQVRAACEEAYAIVPSGLKPKRLNQDGPETSRTVKSHTNEPPATLEAITEALNHIPNEDLQWDDWKKILMAVFACSNGDEQAYFAFLTWSKKSIKHNDRTTRNEWNGCKASPPRSLGFGTLHFYATKHGWTPSSEIKFNTDKRDAAPVDVSGFDAWPTQPSRYKTAAEIIAADPSRRIDILKSVGLEREEIIDPVTGEITEVMNPTRDTGGLSMQEYQGVALNTRVEGGTPGNMFFTGEPERLKLTQDEIDNGSMPRTFADDFPHEWLFTSSLIGRIAHWIDSTCLYQHRLYCLMNAFTIFGTIVGRQYRTKSGLRPSMSVIIIGKTGVGKEPMFEAATELFTAAGLNETRMGPRGGWSSGTGVVNGLYKRPSMWVGIDEFGKKLAAYGRNGDQNQREMVAMYLEAIANNHIGGKGYASEETETRNVTFPNLNIFGASQMDQLTEALSSSAASDGFIQRFLFVPTFAYYPPMRRGFDKPEVPEHIVNEIKAVVEGLQGVGGTMATNDVPTSKPHMRQVEMTAEAENMMYLLDDRKRDLLSHDRTMWVRSVAHTIKIASLEAIAVNPQQPLITAEGLNSARKLVDWFMRYVETYVSPKIGDNETERDLNKMKSMIGDSGEDGLSKSAITRKFHRLKPRDRDDMLKTLMEGGDIEECIITNPQTKKKTAFYRVILEDQKK